MLVLLYQIHLEQMATNTLAIINSDGFATGGVEIQSTFRTTNY